MLREKRHLIFVSEESAIFHLLADAVSDSIGLEICLYNLDDYDHLGESLPEHKKVDTVVFFTGKEIEVKRMEEIYKFWRKNFPDMDFLWCHAGIKSDGDWTFAEWVKKKKFSKLTTFDMEVAHGGLYSYFLGRLNTILNS